MKTRCGIERKKGTALAIRNNEHSENGAVLPVSGTLV
jgi:hypothetical protein